MNQQPQKLGGKKGGKAFNPQGAKTLPLAASAPAAQGTTGRKFALGGPTFSTPPAAPPPPAPAPGPASLGAGHRLAGPGEEAWVFEIEGTGPNGRRFLGEAGPVVFPAGTQFTKFQPRLVERG